MKTVLVVGATGATGKHVVQMLLNKGHKVKVIVRSKDRMMDHLNKSQDYGDRLFVKESAILDVPQTELEELVSDCDAIISCLGHREIYSKQRTLVTDAVKNLTQAAAKKKEKSSKTTKFILMGSNGVANPNGKDDVRPLFERAILALVRCLVPPHVDNEKAAAYLYDLDNGKATTGVEWSVLRPDDLIDTESVCPYDLAEKPGKGLFGGGTASRCNVADAMVRLVLDDDLWKQWKSRMPVLNDTVLPNKEKNS